MADPWQCVDAVLTAPDGVRALLVHLALPSQPPKRAPAQGPPQRAWCLDGVKVFAIPDFACVEADGSPVVVDWKTGKAREGYDEQVLGYALYVSQRYRLPMEKVRASLVYLNDGVEHQVQVDANAVEGFKARFAQSVARMRELLADPATNPPRDESAFPQTENLSACTRCAFRRPCGREAAAAKVA